MGLTAQEHEFLNDTATLCQKFYNLIDLGGTREQDIAEFQMHIHGIQYMVMANSAAREYPDLYRLRGGSLK